MFRLSALSNFLSRVVFYAACVPLLAFSANFVIPTEAVAQPACQAPGNATPIRYFFTYTDGDFDSGLSTDFNVDSDSVDNGCITFLDGDTDLDANRIHLSCSVDYSVDRTAVGNGLTVKNWSIEWSNGKRCGDSGIVTIEKEVEAGSDQSQEFEFDGPDGASYSLSHGESESFLLPAGEYTVEELVPAGWDLADLQCDDPSGNTTTDLGNAQATIVLDVDTSGEDPKGEDITCTFTNEEIPFTPDLRIEKTDGGISVDEGSSFAYTLTVFNDGNLTINSYTIDETVPANTTFNAGGPDGGLWSCSGTAAGSTCELTGGPLDPGESESFSFPLTVDELWAPDPETGLCGEEPENPQVDNTGAVSYTGDGDDATPGNNSDSDTTPINVSCTDNPATLTVVKFTDPEGSSQSFDFTGSDSTDGFDSFSLTGQAGSNSESFTLPGGNYSVSESVPTGWELTDTECSGGNTVGNINLSPGDDVTCTFTNTQQGQIIIAKETDPDGDPQSFDFTRDYGGDFSLTDGTFQGSAFLSPGNYSATESVPEGWELDTIVCDDGNSTGNVASATANVVLDAGEKVRCEFTNRKLDPGISITKSDGGISVDQGDSFAYTLEYENTGELDLTDVQVSETVPANTTFNAGGPNGGDWSCDGSGAGSSCTFDVAGGLAVGVSGSVQFPLTVDVLWEPDEETGICPEEPENPQVDNTGSIVGTSVNGDVDDSDSDTTPINVECEDNPATLTVAKVVSSGDETQSFDFTGSSSEDGFDSFSLTGGDSQSFTLPGGNYSVSETVPAGWELTDTECTGGNTVGSIDLEPGDEVTCTFTNRELEAGLSVIKRTNGNEIREGFCEEGTIIVGEPVEWTYAVANTGEQPLEITSIVDDAGTDGDTGDDFAPAFVDGDDNSNNLLDPGETWNYAASGTAELGEYSNIVTVEAEVVGSQEQVAAKAEIGTLIDASDSSGYCGVQVDLAIEKTDGDLAFVPEGTSFAYTLTYHNLGSVDVTGVVITETVPEHTTFNAGGPDGGLWTCGGTAAGSTCTHEVGALAAGASGSVQFPLTVDELVEPDPETGQCPTDPPSFVVDNTGSIQDDGTNGADSNPDNNSDSDTTPVLTECEDEQLEPPAIDIEKDPDSQLIEQGESANFTITVTNTGPVTLFNVVVTDPQSPDCDRDIGTMEPGAVVSYDCERLNVRGNFTNVATATGDDGEGNDVSDEDSARVNVLIVDEPAQEHPIPTLSQWALILMAGLMLLLGGRRVRVWTRR